VNAQHTIDMLCIVNYHPEVGRRIDLDDLLDSSGVAVLLDLANPNAVSVYRRRYPDFPKPAFESGRCILWLRGDIEAWARSKRS
jgi:predicted DNA-binding transcriptional regulator AlpA